MVQHQASGRQTDRLSDQVQETMQNLGFAQGRSNPCLYWHQTRDIQTMVHGDDFVSAGKHKDLKWLQNGLETTFETKYESFSTGKISQFFVEISQNLLI